MPPSFADHFSDKAVSRPLTLRDGQELFYLAPDGKVMSVAISTRGPNLQPGVPKELFAATILAPPHVGGGIYFFYAVSGDGQRFLIPSSPTLSQPTEALGGTPIVVV